MFELKEIEALSSRSIVSLGDTSRIKKAMLKAENEKKLTIGYIGGSITEGAITSSCDKTYASLTTRWWKEKFPDAEINHINAGIGATDSLLGVHRVQKDLLNFKPDFVVVEYAVNDDRNSPSVELVYEGLIRRILQSENKPGIMLMFLTLNDGNNAQHIHEKVGFQYNLPMNSFRDAMWPEVKEGRIKWEDIEADIIHPNDCGHYLLARFLTDRLKDIYEKIDEYSVEAISDTIKEPLTTDLYEHAAIFGGNDINPVIFGGWSKGDTHIFTPGWIANETDKAMVFEVRARSIGVIYKRYNSGNMGRAKVRVDDRDPVVLEGHFPCYWGGYAAGELIATDLEDCIHRLEITFLDETHPDSSGTEFMICGLLLASL